MLKSSMGREALLAGIVSITFPCFFYYIIPKIKKNRKIFEILILSLYSFVILYITLIGRSANEREINLTLFWSYREIYRADVRWQIYMNVFLFIPFGFLIQYVIGGGFWKTVLISLILSVVVETLQYYGCRGLCEFDDIFNNTLGGALGYFCWNVLERVNRTRE